MGAAVLAREFARTPPREPLTSIPALWRDFNWRYVEHGRQDPVVAYTKKSKNIRNAILRACDSRGEDGKMFFHQSKVTQPARDAFAEELIIVRKEIKKSDSFWWMFIIVKECADRTPGIGPVTRYDVSSRIGYYLGLEPEHLYIHAGVIPGAAALGIRLDRGTYCVDREDLPTFFHDKNLDHIESFLCGYRSEIERVVREKRRNKRRKK